MSGGAHSRTVLQRRSVRQRTDRAAPEAHPVLRQHARPTPCRTRSCEGRQMNTSNKLRGFTISSMVVLLAAAVAGCSDRDPILGLGAGVVAAAVVNDISVLSSNPTAAATLVCPDATIEVTFTVPSGLGMDPLTVNSTTFTIVGPGAVAVV